MKLTPIQRATLADCYCRAIWWSPAWRRPHRENQATHYLRRYALGSFEAAAFAVGHHATGPL